LIEYDHSVGCAVTGGYVYRGASIPALYGTYVYGDFCSGNLWGGSQLFTATLPNISTFGEDAAGELYAATLTGDLYRIVDAANLPTRTPTLTRTATRTPTPTRTQTPTRTVTVTRTTTPTRTSTKTPTANGTATLTPTATPPLPTATVTPTRTVTATPTETPTPDPNGFSFSDNFDDRPGPALGNGWVVVAGNLSIQSPGQLRNDPAKGDHMAIQPGLSNSTERVSADFTSTDGNLGPGFGVILRYQDPANYYRIYRRTGGMSLLVISRFVNGVETVLASASLTNPIKNVPFRLEGRANGRLLTLALDGLDKVFVLDSTFSAGNVGIVIRSGGGTVSQIADNFLATSP
jgi:hypothetical protein